MEKPDTSTPGQPLPRDRTILALAELFESLDSARNLAEASIAVVDFAVLHLGSDVAGICLREPNGRTVRLAASNSVLVELDSIEAGMSEGPSTARVDDGEAVTVSDTRADRLWADWSSAAAERGLLSACLAWMPPLRGRSVTLQLFSSRVGAFPPGDPTQEIVAVAKLVGLAVRHIDRFANLAEAMATRDLIGQAQGIVMERYDLTSEQAIQFLRRTSQQSQQKVRDIAHDLVSQSAGKPDQEGRPPEHGAAADDPAPHGP
ncbi:MAG: ANTAR domain-containing protein [Actinomycetota bacterium]|nr:ANTAR domain-containing protein [Actinomycetota bacterium]